MSLAFRLGTVAFIMGLMALALYILTAGKKSRDALTIGVRPSSLRKTGLLRQRTCWLTITGAQIFIFTASIISGLPSKISEVNDRLFLPNSFCGKLSRAAPGMSNIGHHIIRLLQQPSVAP